MVRINPPPLGKLLPRHAEASVTDALTDTRVVLVNGARQSGKSTLVGVVAKGRDAQWRNLDNAITRQAAIADPVGFVDSAELMVIDEIQRVPDLLLAIKEQVDADPDPAGTCLPVPLACWACAACRIRCPAGPRRSSCGRWPRANSTAPRTGSSMPSSTGAAGGTR